MTPLEIAFGFFVIGAGLLAGFIISRLLGWFSANVAFGYRQAAKALGGGQPAIGKAVVFSAARDSAMVEAIGELVDEAGASELRDTAEQVLLLDTAAMREELTEEQVRELLKNRLSRMADFVGRTLDVLEARRR